MTIQYKSRQGGFTLIELIVVIIVLGILAATAAPKFIDFGKDARVSTLKGLEGATKSTNSMVYGKAAMSGVQNQSAAKVDIFDTGSLPAENNVSYGYLKASAVVDAMQLSACATRSTGTDACDQVDWVYEITADSNIVFFPAATYNGANADENGNINVNCSLTYFEANTASQEPAYSINDAGC